MAWFNCCFCSKLLFLLLLILLAGCDPSGDYIQNLNSSNISIQKTAIFYIGEEKEEAAVPILLKLLDRKVGDEGFVISVVQALGKIKAPAAVDVFTKMLPYAGEKLQLVLIEALGKIRSKNAVASLNNLLATTNSQKVKLTVIWAMGNIGGDIVLPALTKLLDSPDKYVRFNAYQALLAVTAGY